MEENWNLWSRFQKGKKLKNSQKWWIRLFVTHASFVFLLPMSANFMVKKFFFPNFDCCINGFRKWAMKRNEIIFSTWSEWLIYRIMADDRIYCLICSKFFIETENNLLFVFKNKNWHASVFNVTLSRFWNRSEIDINFKCL